LLYVVPSDARFLITRLCSMDHHDRFLPFGTECDDDSSPSPEIRRCAIKLYQQAWDAYEQAGCPYGCSDRALLLWYTFYGTPAGSPSAPRVSGPRKN
jgi:hypothetical protein